MQELKWEMDRQLSTLRGSVDAAGKKEYQRLLNDKNEFLDDVYRQNPDFKKANETYAGDIAMEQAQELGKKRGLSSGNVEDQLKEISGLNKSEKQAYLQGVMSNVYSALGRNDEDALGAINFIASENAQKVLAKLVGKDEARKVMQEIKTQKKFRTVEQQVMGGSQTDIRAKMVEAMRKRNQPMNIEDMKKIKVVSGTANWLLNKLPKKFGKFESEEMIELADLLTKKGGVEAAIQRMESAGVNKFEIDEVITGLSAAGLSVGLYGDE